MLLQAAQSGKEWQHLEWFGGVTGYQNITKPPLFLPWFEFIWNSSTVRNCTQFWRARARRRGSSEFTWNLLRKPDLLTGQGPLGILLPKFSKRAGLGNVAVPWLCLEASWSSNQAHFMARSRNGLAAGCSDSATQRFWTCPAQVPIHRFLSMYFAFYIFLHSVFLITGFGRARPGWCSMWRGIGMQSSPLCYKNVSRVRPPPW